MSQAAVVRDESVDPSFHSEAVTFLICSLNGVLILYRLGDGVSYGRIV